MCTDRGKGRYTLLPYLYSVYNSKKCRGILYNIFIPYKYIIPYIIYFYQYYPWNKKSQLIFWKKNLSLVTVTNDKFNLKIILTFFLSSEVRTDFILSRVHDSLICHPWDRHLSDVSPLSHRPAAGRVLVSPTTVHSFPVTSYLKP